MISKVTLLIQSLLIMVILISSMGEARHLVEKQNDADSIKYCAKTSAKDNNDASSDCFLPGAPGGLPMWPWPLIPGPPAAPITPSPGAPRLPWWLWPFTPSPHGSPSAPSPSESGAQGLPWWLWPFIPSSPGSPSAPSPSSITLG